jgi:hypothetical protein
MAVENTRDDGEVRDVQVIPEQLQLLVLREEEDEAMTVPFPGADGGENDGRRGGAWRILAAGFSLAHRKGRWWRKRAEQRRHEGSREARVRAERTRL